MIEPDIIDLSRVPPGQTVRLKDYDPGWVQTKEMKALGKDVIKERAGAVLRQNLEDLAQAQELLYADDRYAVLVILQAMDAAGKDGTIKHVMSGVNPQGCQVFSTIILKFFLHKSKKEQKRRFLERLERPDKHWKFSAADLAERVHWDDYVEAYEAALGATSTAWAPWYVVPADHKWVTRAVVADVLTTAIRSLDLSYPVVTEQRRRALADARKQLEQE